MCILAGTTFAAGATYMTSEKVIVSTPDASLGIEQVKVGGVCVTYRTNTYPVAATQMRRNDSGPL